MAGKDGLKAILKIGAVQFTGQLSGDFNYSVDTIDTTNKDDGGHKNCIGGEDGGTIDVESVYDPTGNYSLNEVFAAAKAKAIVALTFGGVDTGDDYVDASGIINNVRWGAPKNDKQTVSCSIQLTGEIDVSQVV